MLTGGTRGGIAASKGGCSNPVSENGAEGARGERGAAAAAANMALVLDVSDDGSLDAE